MLPKLVSATDIVLYETMDTYGGGGSVHVGKPHFYLIVKSGDEAHSESIQKFFRMGVNTSSNYIFVFIDIRGERRLERDLKQLNGGARLYGEIAAAAPAFLITDGPIPKLESVKAAELYPISDYDKDVDHIYRRMGLHSKAKRMTTIAFLRRVNRHLSLKPSIGGFGVNLNEAITDLLDRMERTAA